MNRRLVATSSAFLLGFALAASFPTQADAVGSCANSSSYTWTGDGDGSSWTDPQNWAGQHVPTTTDSAVIVGSSATQVGVSANVPSAICNLTLGDNATLEPDAGGLTVNGTLNWSSGTDGSLIEGAVVVAGSATLSSSHPDEANLGLSGVDQPASLTVRGTATLDPHAALGLAGAPDALTVAGTGVLHLGSGVAIVSNATGGDFGTAAASFNVSGRVVLDGDATLDGLRANLLPSTGVTPLIDLAGHTLTFPDAGYSRWKSGGRITSATGHGTVLVRNGTLILDGTTTLDHGVTLRLEHGTGNQAELSDGNYWKSDGGPVGAAAVLAGHGTLDLGESSIHGSLTLSAGITTNVHGNTTDLTDNVTYAGDTRGDAALINRGTLTLTAGTLFGSSTAEAPALENYGTVRFAGGSAQGVAWSNHPGSTLAVADRVRASLDDTSVVSAGQVTLGSGSLLRAAVLRLTGGSLAGGGTVKGKVVNSGGKLAPGTPSSPRTLTITGSYKQSAKGKLAISVASRTTHDVLSVGGTAKLGGTLVVTGKSSRRPATGTKVKVALGAKSIKGTFAHVKSKKHPKHSTWKTSYSKKRVGLRLR